MTIKQVLDRRQYPRVGVLQYGELSVLFRQLDAPGTERVWAYVAVKPTEVWSLQDALGPVAFGRVLERLYRNRRVTMALSSDDLKVVKIRAGRGRDSLDTMARSFQNSDRVKLGEQTVMDWERAEPRRDMHAV